MKTTTLLLFTLFITACSTKTVTPNLFATGESMVVTYSSQGCFNHSSNILLFHENNVTVYKTMNEWNQKIDKTKMGALTLTQKDKEGLNKLFAYYHENHDGWCTNVDDIEIKRYKNKKLTSSKKIRDNTCAVYKRKDVLSFSELIGRVEKKEREPKQNISTFDFSTIYTDKVLKNKVSSLISKMLDKTTANKAYADLEKLGAKATPYIIMQMDDFRELPVTSISLKNRSIDAFEGIRHIGVKKVADVLSEILAQLEGISFSYIPNDVKSDDDRKRDIYEWRAWLMNKKR